MKTIYKIIGGGQQVRNDQIYKRTTEIIKVENSTYPEKSGAHGQNWFAGTLWATDLKTVKRWAREWAGKARIKTVVYTSTHD